MEKDVQGRVTAVIAGDYRVEIDGGGEVVCKARGLFRLKKICPCAGDFVTVADGSITEIAPRRNFLKRPPLANLDRAVIVVSTCEPKPNPLIIDKLTVIFHSKDIETLLVFTKSDKRESPLLGVYSQAGFKCFAVDNESGEGVAALREELLTAEISAMVGNTGVGKTSLLNRLVPGLERSTAEISRKLGRGKHTTRTVELHRLGQNSAIADTPGFSTVDTKVYGVIPSQELAAQFREFAPLLGKCKFGGCTHTGEDGCEVCAAAAAGAIAESRYASYSALFRDLRQSEREWG